jgi:hypothetical protein
MHWRVRCYDGIHLKYERQLRGNLSECEIERLLQRLYTEFLSVDEIIGSSLRKNMQGYQSHLIVSKKDSMLLIGENPYLIADLTTS